MELMGDIHTDADTLTELWQGLALSNRLNVCTERLQGTSLLDVNIMRIVRKKPGILIKEIAMALNAGSSTLSSAIKRLEARALLRRTISQNDLRSYGIELTQDGNEAIDEHYLKEIELMNVLLSSLDGDDERTAFVALFGKIVRKLSLPKN